MIVKSKSQEKAIKEAYDALQMAQDNFASMPSAMYFNDLNEAMMNYQQLWFDGFLNKENLTEEM